MTWGQSCARWARTPQRRSLTTGKRRRDPRNRIRHTQRMELFHREHQKCTRLKSPHRQVDPNRRGYVEFEAFAELMERKMKASTVGFPRLLGSSERSSELDPRAASAPARRCAAQGVRSARPASLLRFPGCHAPGSRAQMADTSEELRAAFQASSCPPPRGSRSRPCAGSAATRSRLGCPGF